MARLIKPAPRSTAYWNRLLKDKETPVVEGGTWRLNMMVNPHMQFRGRRKRNRFFGIGLRKKF